MLRRLSFILFTIAFSEFAFAQDGLNNFIRFSANHLTFEEVIEGFEQRLDVYIQYDASLVSAQKHYDVNYVHIKGKQALSDFLSRTGLDYVLEGKQIILKKKVPVKPSQKFVLSGRIFNKYSGEFINNARLVNNRTGVAVYSSDAGYFTLFLETDTNIVSISYPGFDSLKDTLMGDRDYFIGYELILAPESLPVAEISLTSKSNSKITSNGHSDYFDIVRNKMRSLPHLLGEPDVIRIMSLFPGVVGGSEGMLGMYIRGGASDQNLVLLDDVPVFNSFHLYGIFSIFNDDIVKSARLMKGGFPARYGGRLSSVVAVQSKEGNTYRTKGSVSVGLMAAKVFLEGPLIKNRTTFAVAFRRSYVDFLTRPVVRRFFNNDSLNNNVYYFWDANARITHRFSNRSRLSLSMYTGKDVGGVDEKTTSKNNGLTITERRKQLASWGNFVASAKWNYYLGTKTGITLKAHVTSYNYSFSQTYSYKKDTAGKRKLLTDDQTKYTLKNGIMDQEASFLLSHRSNNNFGFHLGGGYIQHSFTPGNRSLESSIEGVETTIAFNDPRTKAPEVFAFAEAEIRLGKRWFAELGLRNSWYILGKEIFYVLPEPRCNVRFKLNQKSWLKMNAMRTWQFFHLLTNLTLGLPSDLWVPSSKAFSPSLSDHLSMGYTRTVKEWQISTEIFYKKLQYLLEYKDNAGYVTSAINWENAVTSGNGEAYGWEIMAEKTTGRLTGWASYAWMHNLRQFDQLNQGKVFPARYDRRHNIYLAAVYRIKNGFDFSASWTYNSGFAVTTPIGKYASATSTDPYREIFIYGDRNNTRTIANHRLDFAFNFEKQKKYYTRIWSFGLYNAYNRRNPFYVNIGYDSNGNRALYQISLFPIMPNLSYKINF